MPRHASTGTAVDDEKQLVSLAQTALWEAAVVDTNQESDNSDAVRSLVQLFGLGTNSNTSAMSVQWIDPDACSTIKQQRQLLQAALSAWTPDKIRTWFRHLVTTVQSVLEHQAYIPESAFLVEDNDANANVVPCARSSLHLQFLTCASKCVSTWVQSNSNNTVVVVPEAVLETAVALHDILEPLSGWDIEDATQTHDSILQMCETIWMTNAKGKEQVIVQALPFWVEAVLHSTKKSDLKRLNNVKSALSLLDLNESERFRHLLLMVVGAPLIFKCTEGKQFLSYLLGLSDLRTSLHASMRAQVISGNTKEHILRACGDVYYGAWKDANEDDGRDEIEQDVLQDLVYAILHSANPKLVQNLHLLLEKFHTHKKSASVEALLHRLYGPILWRCVAAANAKVRVNACHVLAQVFPLRSPDDPRSSLAVQKALSAVHSLLQDPDASVRVAASEAVGTILSTYWNVVSPNDIRNLLNTLVTEHASDVTSSAVRAAVPYTVSTLLESSPHTHAVLRDLLPKIGNLIHDKTETVRLAVVQMLLLIKTIPKMHFYHIVPVNHLAARMVAEQPPTNAVAAALTELMVNSYFPNRDNNGVVVLERTIRFCTHDPEAAAVFYHNVYRFRPMDQIARLIVNLFKVLTNSFQQQRKQPLSRSNKGGKRQRRSVEETDEDDDNDDEDSEVLSLSAMASMSETIDILWDSIHVEIGKYEDWNRFLLEEFSGETLTSLLSYFEETAASIESDDDEEEEQDFVREDCHKASAALLKCASRLSSQEVQGLISYTSSMLKVAKDDDESLTSHMTLLCLWGMVEDVASCLANSIRSTYRNNDNTLFGSPVGDSKKRRSSSRRRSSQNETTLPPIPAPLAFRILRDVFAGSDPTSLAAREAILNSQQASDTLEKTLEDGTRYAENLLTGLSSFNNSSEDPENSLALKICEAYGLFALHKDASSVDGPAPLGEQSLRILHWTSAMVTPALKPNEQAHVDPFNDPDLSSIQIEKSFDAVLQASPEEVSRRRSRVLRSSSPHRVGGGVGGIFEESPASESELALPPSPENQIALAKSLMKLSCILFSERLAVGGLGAASIGTAALKWARVFEDESKSLNELVPSFSHLALHLAKTADNFTLLNQLLTHVRDDPSVKIESSPLRKVLTKLLLSRGDQAEQMITKAVKTTIQVANDLIAKETPSPVSFDRPTLISTLWESDKGSVYSALSAIWGSRAASLEFGRQLVHEISSAKDASSPAVCLFLAKCLWMLCDRDSGSKVAADVSNMVREMDRASLEEELSGYFEELVDSLQT